MTIKAWMSACRLCPIACGVNRLAHEVGACGAGSTQIYRQGEQLGEERHLVPSYVVDFAHCNLACSFCSERTFWQKPQNEAQPQDFAQSLVSRYRSKPGRLKSIQWVGGEPSIHLGFIEEATACIKALWPEAPAFILNTNGYFNPELLGPMRHFLDGFVFDFKTCPECSHILGPQPDYLQILHSNITGTLKHWAAQHIVIRHLLLPGHTECCANYVLHWCAEHAPDACINIMDGYIDFEKPWISVTEAELNTALCLAKSLPFRQVYHNGRSAM